MLSAPRTMIYHDVEFIFGILRLVFAFWTAIGGFPWEEDTLESSIMSYPLYQNGYILHDNLAADT